MIKDPPLLKIKRNFPWPVASLLDGFAGVPSMARPIMFRIDSTDGAR
jgi:hypothetical protein